jgi:hypothetical protein
MADRTFYVVVDYTGPDGIPHTRGESVAFTEGDKFPNELKQRGVLSMTPVRREPGSQARIRKDEGE